MASRYDNLRVRLGLSPRHQLYSVKVKSLGVEAHLRAGTTDEHVFRQIFVENEYSILESLGTVTTIVDCGANVGFSSLYFLSRFPNARIVAIEPDPDNLVALRRNLQPYLDRVEIIEGAVWPAAETLTLRKTGQGEWATQVFSCASSKRESGSSVQGVTLDDISQRLGFATIDILKIDIEGSEKELFAGCSKQWLAGTKNIVIEIHGGECRDAVFQALTGFSFRLEYSGELTVLRDVSFGALSLHT
ncbi:MAG: FkbM family methyltransferase [Bryobacteraceae bacterium]